MTKTRTIAVCFPRPLFVPSALGRRAQALIDAARACGHDATAVTLPSRCDDPDLDPTDALQWALVDLADIGIGRRIDGVICLHAATVFVHHPRKVVWLDGADADERVERALRLDRPAETVILVDPGAEPGAVVELAVTTGPGSMLEAARS